MVKVINIDPSGKIRLSRKALLEPTEGQAAAAAAHGGDGEPRGERRGGDRRHRPHDRHGDRPRGERPEPAEKS
jgi:polyribonucleotide nucleotidyltransferase